MRIERGVASYSRTMRARREAVVLRTAPQPGLLWPGENGRPPHPDARSYRRPGGDQDGRRRGSLHSLTMARRRTCFSRWRRIQPQCDDSCPRAFPRSYGGCSAAEADGGARGKRNPASQYPNARPAGRSGAVTIAPGRGCNQPCRSGRNGSGPGRRVCADRLPRDSATADETAIRMALGAGRRRLLGSFCGEGWCWSVAGVAAGLVPAVWAASLLRSFVAGVRAPGMMLYFGVTALLLLAVALAALIAVRRILRMDPPPF